LQHYDVLSWQPWLLVAEAGAVVIFAGIVCQIVQLVVSIRHREELRDVTGDPWNARTLEWSTASPPPAWNFAVLPNVAERDAYWARKKLARATQAGPTQARKYEPIEVPTNTATGVVNAFFAVVTGFALIWHIWWMAALGLLCVFATFLAFAFRDEEELEVPAKTIAEFDRTHHAEVAL
jgi:cytochrome o ubiquinol oxidase subunit 1